jgi:hypothetical protein
MTTIQLEKKEKIKRNQEPTKAKKCTSKIRITLFGWQLPRQTQRTSDKEVAGEAFLHPDIDLEQPQLVTT